MSLLDSLPRENPPRLLFHYTSLDGALAILKSKSIWASNIDGMNDAKERAHSVDILTHCIENLMHRTGFRDGSLSSRITLRLKAVSDRSLGHCVASLSEDGDLLSQWRAYGENGSGIALGFNAALLRRDLDSKSFTLRKVIYDRRIQEEICNDFLNKNFPSTAWETAPEDWPEVTTTQIDEFASTIGVFFKHPAFADEREWRAISGPNHLYDSLWKYRPLARGLTSYLDVPLAAIFSPESETESQDTVPHFQFVVGPKVRKKPTTAILQAISQQVLGKGYGPSLSSAPYVD